MARFSMLFTWDPTDAIQYGVPKNQGFLLIKAAESSYASVLEHLKDINDRQKKRLKDRPEENPLFEMKADIEVFYQQRSLRANALMWSLLTLEANILNNTKRYENGYHNPRGLPDRIITPQEIHDSDMETYAKKMSLYIPKDEYFQFYRMLEDSRLGKIIDKQLIEAQKVYLIVVQRTSSYWDSMEFSEYIKILFERMYDYGITQHFANKYEVLKADYEVWKKQNEKEKT